MSSAATHEKDHTVEPVRLGTLEHLREHSLFVRYGVSTEEWEQVADETHFVELIDGKIIMHSPVSLIHARVTKLVHFVLAGFVDRRRIGDVLTGPFVMDLGLTRKFEPDVMYVSTRNMSNLVADRLIGAADLAIEVASPSTRGYDRDEKRECYRVGQVREYWMIDPFERRVTVDRPAGNQVQELTEGRVVAATCPGFWVEAGWLWSAAETSINTCLEQVLAE